MEWKHYWRNVVKRYQAIIEGWPDNIPFRNLSDISSSLSDLEDLLRRWRCGTTYWKKLTARELQTLDLERDTQITNGEVDAPAPRRRRSDYGKKRPRTKQSGETDRSDIRKKKQKKSRAEVLDTDDSESDEPASAKNNETVSNAEMQSSAPSVPPASSSAPTPSVPPASPSFALPTPSVSPASGSLCTDSSLGGSPGAALVSTTDTSSSSVAPAALPSACAAPATQAASTATS
jgi:hypothetical protein